MTEAWEPRSVCRATRATAVRNPGTAAREKPLLARTREKPEQQWGPRTAKNKQIKLLLKKEKTAPKSASSFFLFSFIFISWRLTTLQYCSDFCHTLTWISHGFTCIPHPDPPSHPPLYPIPLGLPSTPGRALVFLIFCLVKCLPSLTSQAIISIWGSRGWSVGKGGSAVKKQKKASSFQIIFFLLEVQVSLDDEKSSCCCC